MPIQLSELGNKGILIICPNPECKYTWKYGGSLLYATCPSCRRNVKVIENKLESLQSTELGGHNRLQRSQHCPTNKRSEQAP